MQCPYCGQEMSEGKLTTVSQDNLFWLPPEARLPHFVTIQGVEKRGGVSLGGGPWIVAAWRCQACKKLILDCE